MGKILVCNQKMFLTKDEAVNISNEYNSIDFGKIDLIVCPNYLNFDLFSNFKLGSQDCSYEDKGAFTGEVSPYDLSLRNIKYVIIGHSEKRWCDTNEIINKKVIACIRNSMIPIICVGESRLEREMLKTSSVLKKQITSALKNVELLKNDEIIIAYEPVYKIGGKQPLEKKEIEDTMIYIKKVLSDLNINNFKLLYGGSVNKDSVLSIMDSKLIDGYLLGSSSVDIEELKNIVKSIK